MAKKTTPNTEKGWKEEEVMKHDFHKKCTADARLDIVWVDEVCIHCGKSREFTREDEECPIRSNYAVDFNKLLGIQ